MSWLMWLFAALVILGMIGSSAEKKKKLEAEQEVQRRRKEAEDYILNSGDSEAIKTLMLARANPANYSQVMAGGINRGNDTLKTALGVMAGVAAGNLVANAITASSISSALDDMQSELNTADHPSSGDSPWGGDDTSIDI
ncbi:hypothetical protein [Ferriphaselus sp. R-1]|uniref:hypothetical protein n=1 Tax=Ferriphaselus sp. R-1 TaxID=1485544 RepID=UPI000554CD0A|nr:hypothetical protein [Ferriphaselus sp. R-1]